MTLLRPASVIRSLDVYECVCLCVFALACACVISSFQVRLLLVCAPLTVARICGRLRRQNEKVNVFPRKGTSQSPECGHVQQKVFVGFRSLFFYFARALTCLLAPFSRYPFVDLSPSLSLSL